MHRFDAVRRRFSASASARRNGWLYVWLATSTLGRRKNLLGNALERRRFVPDTFPPAPILLPRRKRYAEPDNLEKLVEHHLPRVRIAVPLREARESVTVDVDGELTLPLSVVTSGDGIDGSQGRHEGSGRDRGSIGLSFESSWST